VPAKKTRRRTLSLLSLPVVVAVGVLTVAKLASWQRSQLIADLSDSIAHGETRQAIADVHRLAAMTNPPVRALVSAASSADHQTAGASQFVISQLLLRWEHEIEAKQHVGLVAGQLGELSQTLADDLSQFSATDKPWLEMTTRATLRIANKFSSPKTPLVAVNCDAILTAIRTGRLTALGKLSPVVGGTPLKTIERARDMAVAPYVDGESQDEDQPELSHETSAFAVPHHAISNEANESSAERTAAKGDRQPTRTSSSSAETSSNSDDPTSGKNDEVSTSNETSIRFSSPKGGDSTERMSSLGSSSQHSNSSQPIFRILPAMPVSVPPREGELLDRGVHSDRSNSPSGSRKSDSEVADDEPLRDVDSRELLRQWLAAKDGDRVAVEHELAKRGFGKVTKRIVQDFFSNDTQQRMRVVDDALAEPGAGSEPWLLLLAKDGDADVRLFAVTLMATSNNSALMEKAWQIAIRDRDPRIADLAERLRDRRAGTLLR
jgi:hypothetical protein